MGGLGRLERPYSGGMSRSYEKAISAAGDDADALRAMVRAAHIRCDNLEKLLVLVLKAVGPITISQAELSADLVDGFELDIHGDRCVVSFVDKQ